MKGLHTLGPDARTTIIMIAPCTMDVKIAITSITITLAISSRHQGRLAPASAKGDCRRPTFTTTGRSCLSSLVITVPINAIGTAILILGGTTINITTTLTIGYLQKVLNTAAMWRSSSWRTLTPLTRCRLGACARAAPRKVNDMINTPAIRLLGDEIMSAMMRQDRGRRRATAHARQRQNAHVIVVQREVMTAFHILVLF